MKQDQKEIRNARREKNRGITAEEKWNVLFRINESIQQGMTREKASSIVWIEGWKNVNLPANYMTNIWVNKFA